MSEVDTCPIFNVSEDGSIYCFGHKIAKSIIDIYIKAVISLETLSKHKESETYMRSKYDILKEYADEYDKTLKDHKIRSMAVDTCCLLDEHFFGLKDNTHMWSAYDYPKIGQIIHSSEFFYRGCNLTPGKAGVATSPPGKQGLQPHPRGSRGGEKCGYVVCDHGLLTMSLKLNES
jgi:hypothetical protein